MLKYVKKTLTAEGNIVFISVSLNLMLPHMSTNLSVFLKNAEEEKKKKYLVSYQKRHKKLEWNMKECLTSQEQPIK